MAMSSSLTKSDEYFSLANLKGRGWTASLIKCFLDQPDKTKVNPFYKSASPQKLYLVSRVEEIEKSQEFQEKKLIASKRSRAAVDRAEVKRADLVKKVLSSVHVRYISYKKLRSAAISSKIQYDQVRGNCTADHDKAEEHHIHRWMVNYARHELSNYDSVREEYFGMVGVHDAAEELRAVVLNKIAELWPELKDACRMAMR